MKCQCGETHDLFRCMRCDCWNCMSCGDTHDSGEDNGWKE